MSSDTRLVPVSNRGPATFEREPDGSLSPRRGGGGLVTALTGSSTTATPCGWPRRSATRTCRRVASTAVGASRWSFEGRSYRLRLVESEPEAYDRFYNVVANPMLWFIQHYLWDLSNATDIRRQEVEACRTGYCSVNRDLAGAVLEEVGDDSDAVVMLHDYHLYVAPKYIRRARPDLFLHHFVHILWDPTRRLAGAPADIREDIYEGILSNDIIAFHTRSYRRNFLLCCRELFDLEVDEETGVVHFGGREVGALLPAADLGGDLRATAQRPAVHQYGREIPRRRRQHLIPRVTGPTCPRTRVRGFRRSTSFLEQHQEFTEQVTFIAHLIPSRQDVPEYAEELERIEAPWRS